MAEPSLSIQRGVDAPHGQYTPGTALTIVVTFGGTGAAELTSLRLQETLPAGWTFISRTGGPPPATLPAAGASGAIEFTWASVASFPFNLIYQVQVPPDSTGPKPLGGFARYAAGGPELDTAIVVSVIPMAPPPAEGEGEGEPVGEVTATIQRSVDAPGGAYTAGAPLDVVVTFAGTETFAITALSLEETLPPGWRYDGVVGGPEPSAEPAAGVNGTLVFAWDDPPVFPFNLIYRVVPRAGEAGTQAISGFVDYAVGALASRSPEVLAAIPFAGPLGSAEGEGEGESQKDGGPAPSPPVLGVAAPLNLSGAADGGALDTDVVVQGTTMGTWVAAWSSDHDLDGAPGTDFDIVFARSADDGASWGAPALLGASGAVDGKSLDANVQLATDRQGHWVAVWVSNHDMDGAGTDEDLFVARSGDDGVTWTPAQVLNATAALDGDSIDIEPAIATDMHGNWVVAWVSNHDLGGVTGGDDEILVARSSDNGATWSAPALLNASGASDGESLDEEPHLATDGNGAWVAVWRSNYKPAGAGGGSDYDVLIARSADNGASWSDPELLNSDGAADGVSLDLRPRVAADGQGNWLGVWQSNYKKLGASGLDYDVFVSRSSDNGLHWSAAAYLNNTSSSDENVIDTAPDVACDAQGNWVAVWEYFRFTPGPKSASRWDIYTAYSSDHGATWSDPAYLNSNGPDDGGSIDDGPHLAFDGENRWMCVWRSEFNLESSLADDFDLCYSILTAEDIAEGEGEGEGEGSAEGEGEGEGEGEPGEKFLAADKDHNLQINLSELLRAIQFYNTSGIHCDAGTEDGYAPGVGDETCEPYGLDYKPQDWQISLSELLRLIQFFNSPGYHYCPTEASEDGFCPGIA